MVFPWWESAVTAVRKDRHVGNILEARQEMNQAEKGNIGLPQIENGLEGGV